MNNIYVDAVKGNIVCTGCNFQKVYTPGADPLLVHLEDDYEKARLCNLLRKLVLDRGNKPSQFASLFDSLKYEDERLATFVDWPYTNHCNYYYNVVEPRDLAKAGFFFLRTDDKCACIFCRVIIGDWWRIKHNIDTTVKDEHYKHFSDCPFLNDKPVGNIEMKHCNILNTFPEPPLAIEEKMLFYSKKELKKMTKSACSVNYGFFDATERRYEVFPRLKCEIFRMETFSDWPLKKKNDIVDEMAFAGFYYTGITDHVRCAYCGFGLRNWRLDDNPLEEHARAYPDCPFVNSQLFPEYTQLIKNPRRKRIINKSSYNDNNDASSFAAAAVEVTNYYYHIPDTWLDILAQNDLLATLREKYHIPLTDIKNCTKLKLQRTGVPFFSVESFVKYFFKFIKCNYDSQIEKNPFSIL